MKTNSAIRNYKHSIGICLGIIAALVIITSETCYYGYLASQTSSIEVSQDDNGDDGEHAIISISKDAVTSIAHLFIQQVLHFISDIYSASADDVIEIPESIPDFNSYFRTLFRLIISPNAP
ncbi:hypothetical protein LVD15_09925 [Fulvivirga maritima]|uniref:hypothetical protein n=1 Tax=Fulvivirga maritima TaxID=2904247 RepID=UPI001F2A4708|nr:hypothetical protein [Fulvivirga maritima]UII28719.1 hypothetical protein LVD15_09925 [Fulvivirga maritima]